MLKYTGIESLGGAPSPTGTRTGPGGRGLKDASTVKSTRLQNSLHHFPKDSFVVVGAEGVLFTRARGGSSAAPTGPGHPEPHCPWSPTRGGRADECQRKQTNNKPTEITYVLLVPFKLS